MKKTVRIAAIVMAMCLMITFLPIRVEANETGNWTDAGNYDLSWYAPSKDSFTLSTAAQLAGLAVLVNGADASGSPVSTLTGDIVTEAQTFSNKYIELGGDIDLSGHNWTPIGSAATDNRHFSGSLNGNDHVISNMTINEKINNSNICYGLFGCFGYFGNGSIQDVRMYNCSVELTQPDAAVNADNNYYVGILAARANAPITNVSVSGSVDVDICVSNSVYIGGVIGYGIAYSKLVNINCSASITAKVKGLPGTGISAYVGCLSGQVSDSVENCGAVGDVDVVLEGSTNSSYIGGFVGMMNSYSHYFKNSYVIGSVNVTQSYGCNYTQTGGMAGAYLCGTLLNCYASSDVTFSGGGGYMPDTGILFGWIPSDSQVDASVNMFWDEDRILTVDNTELTGDNKTVVGSMKAACVPIPFTETNGGTFESPVALCSDKSKSSDSLLTVLQDWKDSNGDSNHSDWVEPEMDTLSLPVHIDKAEFKLISETFENNSDSLACWTIPTGNNSWTTSAAAHGGASCLFFNGENGAEPTFASPMLKAGGGRKLTFWYKTPQSSENADELKVSCLRLGSSVENTLGKIDASSDWTKFEAALPDDAYIIRFTGVGGNGGGVFIDDISVGVDFLMPDTDGKGLAVQHTELLPDNAKLFVGRYDVGGKLLDITPYAVTKPDDGSDLSFPISETGNFRAFLLDNTTCTPICEAARWSAS